jgi:molybdenum transport protein
MGSYDLGDARLRALLEDDVPCGDLTSAVMGVDFQHGRVEFRARQDMVVCASEEAVRLFELVGAQAQLHWASGSQVEAGELLLEAQGPAGALHKAWKTAQVLMEWASGIAGAVAAIVDQAASSGRRIPVMCTRKNLPGTKDWVVKAVRAGGGGMHRLGLSESLLLFPEHRLYLDESPADLVARVQRQEPEKKLVVEVASIQEACTWAKVGVDVLQLEKFSPAQVLECRKTLSQTRLIRPLLLAVAGGVNVGNAAAYAQSGADLLVTSAPYGAPAADVAVRFKAD